MKKDTPADDLLLMAEIMGAHGLRGDVRLKFFGADPRALAKYPPLRDAAGAPVYKITRIAEHSGTFLATLDGVSDRTAAEKMLGTRLYLRREDLPKARGKGVYYHADLIGLAARLATGAALGRVVAVANFGAGDLLEIKPLAGNSFYVPFTDAIVPEVDLDARTLTVDAPEGLIDLKDPA